MERLKWILAWLLFAAGALALFIVPFVIAPVLDGVAPVTPDRAIPAFTVTAIQVLGHVEVICYGVLALAVIAAVLAVRRAQARADARYWIAVLAAVEFYACMFLLFLALLGLVVLPHLANTPQPATITAAAQTAESRA